jgi:hypothetical protein
MPTPSPSPKHFVTGLVVVGLVAAAVLYGRATKKSAETPIPDAAPKPKGILGCSHQSPSGLLCDEPEHHDGCCYNAQAHRQWYGVHVRES